MIPDLITKSGRIEQIISKLEVVLIRVVVSLGLYISLVMVWEFLGLRDRIKGLM